MVIDPLITDAGLILLASGITVAGLVVIGLAMYCGVHVFRNRGRNRGGE